MYLYIDGSNIRAGGGKTHIVELLKNANPDAYDFERVILFGYTHVLDEIPGKIWLSKRTSVLFKLGYPGRMLWQAMSRSKPINGIWFVPGAGSAPGSYVTMCQNLLPIDKVERRRYFFSFTWLRLVVLGWLNLKAFQNASGVIFLNNYCFEMLPESVKVKRKAIVPHGVSDIFKPLGNPKERSRFELRLIYVSTVDEYKHQWKIAQAVKELNEENYLISIDFIGPSNPISLKRLNPYLTSSVRYHSWVDYAKLPEWYSNSDVFIFGSSCETFGMVLLEAMACGLPILSSNKSSMSETLGDHAIYFDPLEVESIKGVILKVCKNPSLIEDLKQKGINYAKQFTWKRTADETFKFIQDCAKS